MESHHSSSNPEQYGTSPGTDSPRASLIYDVFPYNTIPVFHLLFSLRVSWRSSDFGMDIAEGSQKVCIFTPCSSSALTGFQHQLQPLTLMVRNYCEHSHTHFLVLPLFTDPGLSCVLEERKEICTVI